MKNGIAKKTVSALVIATKLTKLLKVVKAIKILKPIISLATIILSFVAYSGIMGWAMAGIFIVLLFFHELGHILALRMQGQPLRLPYFIPMFGAFILIKEQDIDNRNKEAFHAYGGPLLGTLTTFLLLIPFYITGHHIWLLAFLFGIFINMFNMIPISPLDGGRITQAVSKHFKWVGIGLLLLLTISMKDAGLLVVWMLVIWDMDKLSYRIKFRFCYIIISLLFILGFGFGFYHNYTAYLGDVIMVMILFGLFTVFYILSKSNYKKDLKEYERNIEQYLHLKEFVPDLPIPEKPKNFEKEIKIDTRPTLPSKQRLMWLGCFIGLLAVQLSTFIYYSVHIMNLLESK